jgi:hypothetical protein
MCSLQSMDVVTVVIVCMVIISIGVMKAAYDCRKLEDDSIEENPYSLIDHTSTRSDTHYF